MTLSRHGQAGMLALMLQLAAASAASSLCLVNSVTSLSPTSASTGTYTFPTAPVAQSVALSVTVNYTAALGDACRIALSFRRSTLPPSMLLSGGGATLAYTMTSSAGGGSTLLYTSGTPAAANRIEAAFNAPIAAIGATANLSLTAYALMQPASPQSASSYMDSTLSVDVFRIEPIGGGLTLLSSHAFTVTGSVAKVCTIGAVSNPASDTASISISALGAVITTAITRSYANAACNTPSNLQLTSQSGAVVRSGTPPAGFTNLIDYSASAGFSGATASLDTSAVSGASGAESGAAASTSGSTPSGSLTLIIVPKSNSQPLISGSYSDTLRISITPQ